MENKWYDSSYRRNLVDMHIPDWDIKFLSEFDPVKYAGMLVTAGVDTAYIYSSSCVGLFNWPAGGGRMHAGLNGVDMLGQTICECHKRGINTIVYFNIWSMWAYLNHPDWRMLTADGAGTADFLWTPGRYGVCCFNSPYRDFVMSRICELCRNYDFEGLWVDMIVWKFVCCCPYCRAKYGAETGREIPRIINWEDPEWVRFQRKREEWVVEFASELRNTAKSLKPDISVGFQSADLGWQTGLTLRFLEQSDYLSGDFPGNNTLMRSFYCKYFYLASENKPFEFAASVCDPDLSEHTVLKSGAMLRSQAVSSLANGGSFLFKDAIDPSGTLNNNVYTVMKDIYEETGKYGKYLDSNAEQCVDAGIYFNHESIINKSSFA